MIKITPFVCLLRDILIPLHWLLAWSAGTANGAIKLLTDEFTEKDLTND